MTLSFHKESLKKISKNHDLVRTKEQNIGKDGSKDGAKVTDLKFI